MKKDKLDYFETFIKNSEYALEGSKVLRDILNNFNKQDLTKNIARVHLLENKADTEKHLLVNYLLKDFLPPVDREDILNISHKIDDVMDYIDEILINMDILNIVTVRQDVLAFTNLLVECCENVTAMLEDLKNLKRFESTKTKIITLNRLEEKGDALYISAMKQLYKNKKDPIEVISWTAIYNCFEDCFDACEKVADCAEEVIAKNT